MPWFRFRKKKSSDDQRSDVPELEAKPPKLDQPKLTDPAADGGRLRTDRSDQAEASPRQPWRARTQEARLHRRRGCARAEGEGRAASNRSGGSSPSGRSAAATSRPRRRREPQRRAPLPAAKRELLVSVDVGERRVAILEDGQAAEVYLERPERRSIAGNIYLGRVDNVLPGMEAAFVEIGLEKNGFLYVDEIVSPELERGHGRKIQDLISRGQTILVQAVKDPMKTKGARLTTQISLPGRFVVLVPQGEGLGVSRRLDDDERNRLKDILKRLDVKEGGVIVRTAAEGASEEDIERDLVFLQRLWKSIQAKAKSAKAPELVYQEAELPLRVVRDLFTGDFEKAYVDDELTYKRVVGYLKKTSPHMVERLVRYKDKKPLMEAFGVEQEIKSTIGRRVDLPSGGYLIFDYAEAFTVIDVNTGRFVGGRGKNSGGRLEDTITKNNLEAVKEVVRQLRLRDIGGIIVIDFIDMANPKNRATVEEALRSELERDRTKTYVVEISPLGLVEMTRQNVTDGPREVMTRKCPTCGGDGIVYSEASAAIDVERRLRALAAGSRAQAFRVELADSIASALVGPGARRLLEFEALTKKRFFLEGKPETHLDHFVVLSEGKLADLAPPAPVGEDAEVMLQLVEVDRYDGAAAVGKLDGLDVVVADAASQVGKRVKVRIERVLDGRAYARRDPQDEGGARAADGRGRGREADPQAACTEGSSGRQGNRRCGGRARGRGGNRRCGGRARGRGGGAGGRDRRRGRGDAGSRGGPEAEEEDAARVPWRPQAEEGARDGRNGRDRGRRCLGGSAGAGSRRHDPRARRGARPRRQGRTGRGSAGRARARGDGRADDRRGGAGRDRRRSWTSLAAAPAASPASACSEEEDKAWLARRQEPQEEAGRRRPERRRGGRRHRARSRGRARFGERRFRLRPDVRVGRRAGVKGLATLPTRGRPARVSTP